MSLLQQQYSALDAARDPDVVYPTCQVNYGDRPMTRRRAILRGNQVSGAGPDAR